MCQDLKTITEVGLPYTLTGPAAGLMQAVCIIAMAVSEPHHSGGVQVFFECVRTWRPSLRWGSIPYTRPAVGLVQQAVLLP